MFDPLIRRSAMWLLCVLACIGISFAQSERGTITGAVRDSSGASIAGAKVTIKESSTNSITTLMTNEAGEFTVPSLAAGATVKQSLRPFPQYQAIDTYSGGGDHSGHSTYHSAMMRFEKRYSSGVTLQTSYVFSKLLTDSDTYWGSGQAEDQYNRGLEKSIGQFDQTHNFKFAAVYDLPFGVGQKFLTKGPAAWILGNWRVSSVNLYGSGIPIGISTSYGLPLFNGRTAPYVSSFSGWQPSSWKNGSFNPAVDNFLVPYGSGPFPLQGSGTALNGFGNMTRYNPKLRQFANKNENVSVTRTFKIHESIRMEFRAEAFNVFNRVRFGTGSTQLQNQNFGHLTSSGDLLNSPRTMQMALKLYF